MSEIVIDLEGDLLLGDIHLAQDSSGLVIFAHGSGSGRLSPRNRAVANALNKKTIGTCLFDLLTDEEEAIDLITREYRFNIPLLANRLAAVTKWLQNEYQDLQLNMGYFGASTGAAAALIASTKCPEIKAVVSRGGRPDLAEADLPRVTAATLLIVGGEDNEVIELNRYAFAQLSCQKEMTIIPGATHLFEEPGALDEVTQLAITWFETYL